MPSITFTVFQHDTEQCTTLFLNGTKKKILTIPFIKLKCILMYGTRVPQLKRLAFVLHVTCVNHERNTHPRDSSSTRVSGQLTAASEAC